jgi:trans-aconitate 2-methyltransferase
VSRPGEVGSSTSTSWDPNQYRRYSDHRLRPAIDLVERVPLPAPQVIFDLGCGTGNVTRLLARRWPEASIVGLDHSPEMLAEAKAGEPAAIRWIQADLRDWQPDEESDLVFSNATLHWVPDHEELFSKLISWIKPGGALAVQMPQSWGLASHRLMRETLADLNLGSTDLRWRIETDPVAEPSAYYRILAPRTRHLDLWETEYLQLLEGPDPVLEWVKGTGLRPVLQALAADERDRFVSEYRARLRIAYPPTSDGRTLYPFRRLFMVAQV